MKKRNQINMKIQMWYISIWSSKSKIYFYIITCKHTQTTKWNVNGCQRLHLMSTSYINFLSSSASPKNSFKKKSAKILFKAQLILAGELGWSARCRVTEHTASLVKTSRADLGLIPIYCCYFDSTLQPTLTGEGGRGTQT